MVNRYAGANTLLANSADLFSVLETLCLKVPTRVSTPASSMVWVSGLGVCGC